MSRLIKLMNELPIEMLVVRGLGWSGQESDDQMVVVDGGGSE